MKAHTPSKVPKTLKVESFLTPNLSISEESIFDQLIKQETYIALLGLAPEGRALGIEFSQSMEVIGFDLESSLVQESSAIIQGILPNIPKGMKLPRISFTDHPEALKEAKVYVVNVPNDVDDSKVPVLDGLEQMTRLVGEMLKVGDYVIFTSSMYPGCTEELCIPLLEEASKLRLNIDFKVGYVPLRSNTQEDEAKVMAPMIISGSDVKAAHEIHKIFGLFSSDATYIAPSIKVAESAHLLIHIQRDVNIALINEFSMIMRASEVDSTQVMDAAASQFDFKRYDAGLVGGTNTGLVPYHLMHQANRMGVDAELIKCSRMVNEWMPFELVNRCEEALDAQGKSFHTSRVLVKGISYKENVSDVRNSKAVELCKILEIKGAKVDIQDPMADAVALRSLYGLEVQRTVHEKYDLVIIAVKHTDYSNESSESLKPLFKDKAIICDIGNVLKHIDADSIKVAL